ncbi:MAG TPA: glutaredoxin family protein [Thermodesulfobacteriota bacterium]|nr:glutaredoxin family protein [Thermodesulfobacteriota bacterium]HNU70382.1 glutaredoxin family protein [Thermodesulfobacteriota bacterium]
MVLILFVRTTCPKCEQAHELLEQINDENVITADPECYAMEVDIDEDFNWLAEASLHSLLSTPSAALYKDLTDTPIKTWAGSVPTIEEINEIIRAQSQK